MSRCCRLWRGRWLLPFGIVWPLRAPPGRRVIGRWGGSGLLAALVWLELGQCCLLQFERNAARSLDWDPISELHQGQRSYAPHQRAGHMTAPDHFARAASKTLARGGRSLIASPLSIASCFFCCRTGVTVLSAVGRDPPQHLVRSTGAAMSTTGSHGVFMWPKALLRSRLHPRPVGQLSHPRRRFGWISVKDSSGGHRLLGPAEWLARTPDAVHDHREFPSQRYARLACT